jgi:hypothetical protein
MRARGRIILCLAVVFAMAICNAPGRKVPRIEGEWWTVASDPDLGDLTDPKQQPVDFGIWQAADGTFQLWSCIRHTKEPGWTRLFFRWEGEKLTDRDWKPLGIAMQADPDLGETTGGLQAPFVIRRAPSDYLMLYGDWVSICSAESRDGKHFRRRLAANGKPSLFSEGPKSNSRDPMVLDVDGLWHCYYTASDPAGLGTDYCRTSTDTLNWSEPHAVARGGRSGDGPWSAECPYVVRLAENEFYLFRTQHYGENAITNVYCSDNPLYFGIDEDEKYYVGSLPVAAPEVFRHEGLYYIAALRSDLKGIQIARLSWVAGPDTQ